MPIAHDKTIEIMARAMHHSKAWPVVFEARSAEVLATAALSALRAAGYWVARWHPPEDAPGEIALLLATSDGAVGKATMDFAGSWAWNDDVYLSPDQTPAGWTPLPPPPLQQEGGDG